VYKGWLHLEFPSEAWTRVRKRSVKQAQESHFSEIQIVSVIAWFLPGGHPLQYTSWPTGQKAHV
jgi:hypothetical protein